MATQPAFLVPPDIGQLLKTAKTFLPELGRIGLPTGKVVGLAGLATLEQVAPFMVKKKLKASTDTEDDDNTRVVKVQDAINCVDQTFRDPASVIGLATEVVKVIAFYRAGQTNDDYLGEWVDIVAECIREKALKQTAPRKRLTYRYSKRAI